MVKTILVTGAGGSAAFNFIYSLKLAKSKFKIIGIDQNKFHLALSNADVNYLTPNIHDKNKYISHVNKIIKKHNVDFLHPQPDPEVNFLSKYKNLILTKTFLPEHKTIKICQDKFLTNQILNANKVPVPETNLISDKKTLTTSFQILKPSSEFLWLRAISGAGSKASMKVSEPKQANEWIKYWQSKEQIGYGKFIMSEYLPGKEFAFQSLWKNGRLIVSQARERLEYVFGNLTPTGQSSSPAVAVTVNRKDINATCTRAILAVDPKATGIFCVDLKQNKKGVPCITEINAGRFFTTSNFFSVAGLNMPYIYINMGLSEKIPSNFKKYNNLKEGIYWVRLMDMGFKLVDKSYLNKNVK